MNKIAIEQNPVNKQEEIKNILKESQDMVGEKTMSEGIFHKIFRGYVPLNIMSSVDLELEAEEKQKISSYCNLIKITLRRNLSSLDYLVKGYGTTHEEIKHTQTALQEYDESKKKIKDFDDYAIKSLENPDSNLKIWLKELNLNTQNLKTAIVNPFQIDEDAYVPTEVLQRMNSVGLFKLKVPKKYGGLGFKQKEYDLVLQTLAHVSGTLLAIISAHSTIGSAPLMMYGTEAQKEKYLREVSLGNYLVAFGLTEPTSGTDAIGKMKCVAKLSDDGKNWIINGEKIYITNIHRAGLMYMMAKTDLGNNIPFEKLKPTVFIVELPFRITDSKEDINKKLKELEKEGMRMSVPLDLMMIRGSNQAYITFENFKVPVNFVLGEVEDGSRVIFNGLNRGRAGFGASSAEAARLVFESALVRVSTREMFKAFGGKQSDLPQVKKYISRMAVCSASLRAVSDMTTALIEKYGDDMNIIAECAAIKILATEGSWEVANYAMRLWGGTGTMRGHSSGMELSFRDAWIGIIVEGVNEAMKQLVTGVGVQGVKDDSDIIGRHLFALIKPFLSLGKRKSKEEDIKKKKKHKLDLLKLFIPANIRLISGMLRFETGKLDFYDSIWLQYHTKIFSLKTAVLGMKYGNNMVVRQLELIRMADIAMDIFSLAAVQIKLRNLNEISLAETEALKHFVTHAKRRIKENLKQLRINNIDDLEDTKLADLWINEAPLLP